MSPRKYFFLSPQGVKTLRCKATTQGVHQLDGGRGAKMLPHPSGEKKKHSFGVNPKRLEILETTRENVRNNTYMCTWCV